jgi:hypothetical protein
MIHLVRLVDPFPPAVRQSGQSGTLNILDVLTKPGILFVKIYQLLTLEHFYLVEYGGNTCEQRNAKADVQLQPS